MNSMTKDQWDELTSQLERAKAAVNEACGILAEYNPETTSEKRLDSCASQAADAISAAVFWAGRMKRELELEAFHAGTMR